MAINISENSRRADLQANFCTFNLSARIDNINFEKYYEYPMSSLLVF